MLTEVAVRAVEVSDLPVVAGHAWDFGAEGGVDPAVSRDEFEQRYVAWGAEALSSGAYRGLVATRNEEVVGFVWLATVPRVPKPRSLDRTTIDVQSVYVVPAHRRRGVGTALLAEAERTADARVERLVAHTRPGALSAFRAWGFASDDLLVHRKL